MMFRLIIWSFSVLLACVIGLIFLCIGIEILGFMYELENPIILGEEDLGLGFVVIGNMGIMLIPSTILTVFLVIFFKRLFSRLLKNYL